MESKLAAVFVLLILVGIGAFLGYLKFSEPAVASPTGPGPRPPSDRPPPDRPPSDRPPPERPFWGCGLVGKDIDPSKPVWRDLAGALKATNAFGKVSTWNWDTAPQHDEKLSSDFLFFPESQCGAISKGQEKGFPQPGDALVGDSTVASMALGANEPDQPGFCQTYGPLPGSPGPLTNCDSEKMRAGQCPPPPNDCTCFDWNTLHYCKYNVTGCGMWPVGAQGECSSGGTAPFPYQCFGEHKSICAEGPGGDCCEAKCRDAAARNFNDFYHEMGNRGYTYATAPLVASDLSFSRDIMGAAGCDAPEVKLATGGERLRKGCPTHSAFHFYSTGCPEPGASIQGFKDKVQTAKRLNSDFNLAGTVVNELGSLDSLDPAGQPCAPERISGMMSDLFEHLQTEEGRGVVSQMVWFNQDKTGGTFDLRLVNDDTQMLTPLGEQYQQSCLKWAASNGVRASAI